MITLPRGKWPLYTAGSLFLTTVSELAVFYGAKVRRHDAQ